MRAFSIGSFIKLNWAKTVHKVQWLNVDLWLNSNVTGSSWMEYFKLSEKSSVSISTIERLEAEDGFKKATDANLRFVRETLEAAGIKS